MTDITLMGRRCTINLARYEIDSINIYQMPNGVLVDYLSRHDEDLHPVRTITCSQYDLELILLQDLPLCNGKYRLYGDRNWKETIRKIAKRHVDAFKTSS